MMTRTPTPTSRTLSDYERDDRESDLMLEMLKELKRRQRSNDREC